SPSDWAIQRAKTQQPTGPAENTGASSWYLIPPLKFVHFRAQFLHMECSFTMLSKRSSGFTLTEFTGFSDGQITNLHEVPSRCTALRTRRAFGARTRCH